MDAVRTGLCAALGAAVVSGAAQQFTILTDGQNLQIPINAAANRYETR